MTNIQAKQTIVDDSLRETKRHGTEDFPMAVYFDDFSDFENGFISWHWHEEVQITMILEGTFCCSAGNHEQLMEAGDVIFINSGLLHQIRPLKRSQGKLYSFIFRGDVLAGRQTLAYQGGIEPLLIKGQSYLFMGKNLQTEEALHRIVELYQSEEDARYLKIIGELMGIWQNICGRVDYHRKQEALRDEPRVKAALEYMQLHYAQTISLDEIAEAAYISRSELCRCFARVLNTSPKEFLMQYRIRQGAVLLKSEKKISEIAMITGFSSPSHFGSAFLKYMGCTPKQYRAAISRQND